VLLRTADKNKLAIALKGASEPIKDLFYQNMSGRAAKMLKEDMEALGPVRLKDVEEAQNILVTMTKELANSGQITLAEDDAEGELIY
jgi:flagellar motor switch protein FliG